MNLTKRFRNRVFNFNMVKVRKAYGVSSKITDSDLHYLFFDVDDKQPNDFIEWLHRRFLDRSPILCYSTDHGIHCIVFRCCSIQTALHTLLDAPLIDKTWTLQGFKRGYWFLEMKPEHAVIALSYGCSAMEIERVATHIR